MNKEEYLSNLDVNVLFNKYLKTKFSFSLGVIKSKCSKNNLDFDLDAEYLMSLVVFTCPITGISLDWMKEGKGPSNDSASLDRIIPSLGYVKGNVRFISQKANRMKQNSSLEDLKKLIEYMES